MNSRLSSTRAGLYGLITGMLVVSSSFAQDRVRPGWRRDEIVPPADRMFQIGFADGTVEQADAIQEWADRDGTPKINNRRLFDEGTPCRWIRDRLLQVPEQIEAFVEFSDGDVLPGKVARYFKGNARGTIEFLIVEAALDLHSPATRGQSTSSTREVRVDAARVRRVAWAARPGSRYEPSTIVLTAGGRRAFRSLRWNEQSVSVLTESAIETIAFSEIAEICLPSTDRWQAYQHALGLLAPEGKGTIVELHTSQGLRATGATRGDRWYAETFESYQPGRRSGFRDDVRVQVICPVWSVDKLYIRYSTIACWRFWPPDRLPLSRLEPSAFRPSNVIGVGVAVQRDRSAHGGGLASGGRAHGWGFGVHGGCTLEFELPPAAIGFRTSLGLNHSVGDGGCVRATVQAGGQDSLKTLFDSGVLIGSRRAPSTGDLTLPDNARRLVLAVDALHTGRPAGADPLDIRDALDWLEPELLLDLGKPKAVSANLQARQ